MLAVLAGGYALVGPYVLALVTARPLNPPTPAFLAAGGDREPSLHDSGCPTKDPPGQQGAGGIERAVAKAFPPGTPQDLVVRSLSQQGFKVKPPCVSDPSIRYAVFDQNGGGFYGPYPIYAVVTWKVDRGDKLVWATGWDAATGP